MVVLGYCHNNEPTDFDSILMHFHLVYLYIIAWHALAAMLRQAHLHS